MGPELLQSPRIFWARVPPSRSPLLFGALRRKRQSFVHFSKSGGVWGSAPKVIRCLCKSPGQWGVRLDLGQNLPRPALKHECSRLQIAGGVYATLTRHRKGVLQRARNFRMHPFSGKQESQSKPGRFRKQKTRCQAGSLRVGLYALYSQVGNIGLEPITFSTSTRRSAN